MYEYTWIILLSKLDSMIDVHVIFINLITDKSLVRFYNYPYYSLITKEVNDFVSFVIQAINNQSDKN